MLSLAPVTSHPSSRQSRRPGTPVTAFAPAVRGATALRRPRVASVAPPLALVPAPLAAPAPQLPAECAEAAQAARPGDAVLVTVDVVDAAGTLMYRVLDRFVREDQDFRWVPNVGSGPAPAVVTQTTRSWEA